MRFESIKKGMRVVCAKAVDSNALTKGAHGVVKETAVVPGGKVVGVRFDTDVGGHDLGIYGRPVKMGHGWYCEPGDLRLEK